jgi:hypothetical protein
MRSAPNSTRRARNLRRSDQGGGGNRRRRAGAGDFEKARQMRGHGAGDEPGRREDKSEDRHRAARSRRRFSFHFGGADRRRSARDQQPVQGQPDHDVVAAPFAARAPGTSPAEKL